MLKRAERRQNSSGLLFCPSVYVCDISNSLRHSLHFLIFHFSSLAAGGVGMYIENTLSYKVIEKEKLTRLSRLYG